MQLSGLQVQLKHFESTCLQLIEGCSPKLFASFLHIRFHFEGFKALGSKFLQVNCSLCLIVFAVMGVLFQNVKSHEASSERIELSAVFVHYFEVLFENCSLF